MKTTVLALCTLLLISCSKSDLNFERLIEIKFDDKTFKVTNELVSSNESCKSIFVSATYQNSNDLHFRIEFQFSKKGALVHALLCNYTDSNKMYESADFNPTGLLQVRNFNYDESTNYLYFDFEGELVGVNARFSEIDIPQERKHIEGKVEIKNVKKTSCESTFGDLTFDADGIQFFTGYTYGENDPNLTFNPYQFSYFSDNGYRITFKCKSDFWVLPLGTYSFSTDSIENRIDFEQYIGIFRATQLLYLREVDWKTFQTQGSFTIQKHLDNNFSKGVLSMDIYDADNFVCRMIDIPFELVSFGPY